VTDREQEGSSEVGDRSAETAGGQSRPAGARINPAAAASGATPNGTVGTHAGTTPGLSISLEQLRAFYGDAEAVRGLDLEFRANEVTAIIGPSGCGKSTMIRCINRMHEEIPGARAEGRVALDGLDVYDPSVDVVAVRRAIGMVFQKPNPFPTMSIFDNVAAGPRLTSRRRGDLRGTVETALRSAGLWDEVADRLDEPGAGLSGGQQQRLCIARALAAQPEVLLLDEPCSALDPQSTKIIEDLIVKLREEVAVVIVTHNLQQAHRIADHVGFMYLGELVEYSSAASLFANPRQQRTRDYVSGAFG
jgi:phosphate transport system ATP-binding protein